MRKKICAYRPPWTSTTVKRTSAKLIVILSPPPPAASSCPSRNTSGWQERRQKRIDNECISICMSRWRRRKHSSGGGTPLSTCVRCAAAGCATINPRAAPNFLARPNALWSCVASVSAELEKKRKKRRRKREVFPPSAPSHHTAPSSHWNRRGGWRACLRACLRVLYLRGWRWGLLGFVFSPQGHTSPV